MGGDKLVPIHRCAELFLGNCLGYLFRFIDGWPKASSVCTASGCRPIGNVEAEASRVKGGDCELKSFVNA
jgi:hypothetical protein